MIRRIVKNQRGVAIMMVLGGLAFLTALATDFIYQTQIHLRMARTASAQLQAEYLARSGINFTRLLMVKEKSIKSMISQLPGGSAFDPKKPLCTSVQMSTSMLRGLAGLSADGGAEETEESKDASSFEKSEAQEFLNFKGDFDANCSDESSKFNLNVFAKHKSMEKTIGGLNQYDRHKLALIQFFQSESLFKYFNKDEEEVRKVVTNIADWIDVDQGVNERPKMQSGSEDQQYSDREAGFGVRNGPMVTLNEAYMIAGVSDVWFDPLQNFLTVYGSDAINICTADPVVVESLVLGYSQSNPRIAPVNPENRELLDRIALAVMTACNDQKPSTKKITQVVEGTLMQASGGDANGTAGGGFEKLIDLTSGPMRITSIGTVPAGRAVIEKKIEVVIDTTDKDPRKWGVLYWHME